MWNTWPPSMYSHFILVALSCILYSHLYLCSISRMFLFHCIPFSFILGNASDTIPPPSHGPSSLPRRPAPLTGMPHSRLAGGAVHRIHLSPPSQPRRRPALFRRKGRSLDIRRGQV